MTKKFPSQFGNEPQYYNPSGTIPMPQPKDMPQAVWTYTRYRLDWGTPVFTVPAQQPPFPFAPEGWLFTVRWETPFFDMRPDLRSSQGQVKEGVPMWRKGARLYVEITGSSPQQGLAPALGLGALFSVSQSDWYETTNNEAGRLPVVGPPFANEQARLMGPQNNVSSVFTPLINSQAMLGVFSPPGDDAGGGEGYPIRYWKCLFRFSRLIPGAPPPAPPPVLLPNSFIVLQASVY